MKKEKKKDQKKKMIRDWLIFAGIVVVAAVLIYLYPSKQESVMSASLDYLYEMIFILPAVMVMMGLFSVYIPKDTVVKYFGKASGIKGFFLAILFGALPTGPLYVAFPMASTMIKKGARITNIVVFLSAWACIKIPQEMVELQFLGPRFMLARLSLTIVFVGLVGLVIERLTVRREITT